MKSSSKILLLDIETSPLVSYTWGTWEQNVIKVIHDWHILSCALKWLGEPVRVLSLPRYALYKTQPRNDRELVKEIQKYLNEADIVIGHNSDAFDLKKINARIFFHGIAPSSPYQTVDTLKIARRHFSFTSNKLDSLAQFLKIGKKVETGGFALWEGVLAGDKKAWHKMCYYNAQDVVLLEKVYLKLRPWVKTHPIVTPGSVRCPKCGSLRFQKRGYMVAGAKMYHKHFCTICKGWFRGPIKK